MRYLKNLYHRPAVCLMLMTMCLAPLAQEVLAHCPHSCATELAALQEAVDDVAAADHDLKDARLAHYHSLADLATAEGALESARETNIACAAALALTFTFVAYIAWVFSYRQLNRAREAVRSAIAAVEAAYADVVAALTAYDAAIDAYIAAADAVNACVNHGGHGCDC